MRRWWGWLGVCAFLLALGAAPAWGGTLRVGISGDYPPFSDWSGAPSTEPAGLAPDLVRAYAADRGHTLRFVRFAWPGLLDDLAADRFDLAAGGITVRPERSIAGVFTVPIATSGAVVLVAENSPVAALPDLRGLRVGVNAGGHLERVARGHLTGAEVVPIPDNASVLPALLAGRVDAVVTDTREAPHWRAAAPGLRAIGPFTRDRKAWLARADRADLAADLDAWLMAREADGTLARLRAQHLGAGSADDPTASPLAALLAAIDERLALMPAVAEAKRASGAPVDVPAREARVIEAALESARRVATDDGPGFPALDGETARALRLLFRAQMESAKAIQRDVLSRPALAATGSPPDLPGAIRPALIRIGDRVVRLALALPGGLDHEDVRTATHRALAARGLDDAHVAVLGDAIVALAHAAGERAQPARSPRSRQSRQ